MKRALGSILLMLLFATASLAAEDPFRSLDREWEKQKATQNRSWDEGVREMEQRKKEQDRQWQALVDEQDRRWALLKGEVEQKWQEFVHSTKKDWVAYSPDRDGRSRIDFESGKVVFEAVVPESDPNALAKAKEIISKQVGVVLKEKDIRGETALEGQVSDRNGRPVTPENQGSFLRKDLLPLVREEPGAVTAGDGVRRKSFQVEMDLNANHLGVRAAKYKGIVRENASRFGLKPELIMAVIETESDFNPFAMSSARAVGIMQIIPDYAGREAYEILYGADSVPTLDFLLDPENNIRLGSAYLAQLQNTHFKDVEGEVKNRYVSICAYNWGPTAMRKKVLSRYPAIHTMSDKEVMRLLIRVTPEETSNYVQRVVSRMPKYEAAF